MCVKTVTAGGPRLWLCGKTKRHTLLDITSRRERLRDRKSRDRTQRRRTYKPTPVGLVDEAKESCRNAGWTQTFEGIED